MLYVRLKNFFKILLFSISNIFFLGCGNFVVENSSSGRNPSSESQFEMSIDVFSKTLHPVLKNNCNGCHGIFQDPKFAVPSAEQAHNVIINGNLISKTNPSASKFVEKIKSGHNGFSISFADNLYEQISSWVSQVNVPIQDVEVEIDPADFEPVDAISAGSKIKFLVHGGPLSITEANILKQSTNINVIKTNLSNLVDSWMASDEYKKKINRFLYINLQQDGDVLTNKRPDYYPILGTILDGYEDKCGEMGANLREMFVRTAEKIINENRPFNEVITTRKWMVTTATLVMLAWMDNDRSGKPNGAKINNQDFKRIVDNVCAPKLLTSTDYSDWREVEFRTISENISPRTYSDVAGWRSVTDGQVVSFGVPRVGFFTTPMFLRKWITNDDNQFRVTTNQALIGALNETFSLSDETLPMRPLTSQDQVHAVPGTACFKCHSLMDPMRDMWKSILNARDYRFHPRNPPATPAFAFQNVRTNIPTIEAFAATMANHPSFAKGWTQKACQYLNSQPCDESDPEFQRVVSSFEATNFNFNTMYKNMVLSSIVTGLEKTKNHEIKNFYISIPRRFHLCHSLNVRVRSMQAAYGASLSALDGGYEVCSSKIHDYRSGIVIAPIGDSVTEDILSRGSNILSQSISPSPFYAQATNKICEYVTYYFAQNGTFLPSTNTNVGGNVQGAKIDISNFLTHFVGMYDGHPRRELTLNAMNLIFDKSYMESSATADRDKRVEALKQAFAFGCSLPDVLSVGL